MRKIYEQKSLKAYITFVEISINILVNFTLFLLISAEKCLSSNIYYSELILFGSTGIKDNLINNQRNNIMGKTWIFHLLKNRNFSESP
jgi:hypothetical protein